MKNEELYSMFRQFGNFLLKNGAAIFPDNEIAQVELAFTEFEERDSRVTFSGRHIAVNRDAVIIFDVNQDEIIKTRIDKTSKLIKASKKFRPEARETEEEIDYVVSELTLTLANGENVNFLRPNDIAMASVFDQFAKLY